MTNLPAAIVPGSALAFSANVTPTQPAPTGIYQVILDGGNPGTPVLLTGASNSFTIASSALGLGAHTLAVFYSGDATYNFSTSPVYSFGVQEPVPAGSFTLTPATASLMVNGSGPGSAMLVYTVTSVNGYADTVSLSCSNLPAYTSCTFAPTTVTLLGVPAASSILTFKYSTGFFAANEMPAWPGERLAWPIALAALLGVGLRRRSKQWRPALLAAMLTLAVGMFSGCAGNYVFGTTPSGTYAFNVVATGAGKTVQTARVNLVVK